MRRAVAAALLFLLAASACGDRTGLPVDEAADNADFGDAGGDREGVGDAALDASFDASLDALPPIDASRRDVQPSSDCPDADATLVYVLTQQNELYSFYPPTASFRSIGKLVCPVTQSSATPWSMAVNRRGMAYAVYSDGELFRVSTANAACQKTPYAPLQRGWTTFGMGYVADTNDPGETLYVAEASFDGPSKGLATIDTKSFKLSFVGNFVPSIPRAELTGTGDGRLFAFSTNDAGSGSHIYEVDKTSGRIVASNALAAGDVSSAFAFAYWGGDFWVFTSPGGTSTVTRYRPSDSSESVVTTMPQTIVGAGVSTCAPTP